MKLYEINVEIDRILSLAERGEGILPEDEIARLDALDIAFDEKVENVVLYIRGVEAEAEAFEAEAERLAAKASTLRARAGSLQNYLHNAMISRGKDRVQGLLASAKVMDSPPRIVVSDGYKPRGEFARVIPAKREVDKRALLAAFKAGKKLPKGVTVEQGTWLKLGVP